MGAAEQQQFSQYPLRYGDGTLGAAIAQTRDGKDELITPVALWELDDSSGLYLPPGLSQNPRRPRVEATLSGRKEASYTDFLPVSPLAAEASYTSPAWDVQTYEFPNGSTGIVSISALALADAPGTLYLEGSNDGTQWRRVASAAINNTGTGRLRRTNVFTRYVRLRFVNGETPQSSFSLSYSLWQVGDGQGDEHGEGADWAMRRGPLAAGVEETILDIRSAAEIQEILWTGDYRGLALRLRLYKDSGAWVDAISPQYVNGVDWRGDPFFASFDQAIVSLMETTELHDPDNNKFAVRLRRPIIAAKGFRLTVRNSDTTAAHNTGVQVLCRLL